MYCTHCKLPMEVESVHTGVIYWLCKTCRHREEEQTSEKMPFYNNEELYVEKEE